MSSYWSSDGLMVYQGNALDVLKELPAESIHVCCTSPPYLQQRAYPCKLVDWPPVRYMPMVGLSEVEVDAWTGALGLEPDPFAYVGHLVLVWRELKRVLHPSGTCWVVIGDSYQDKQLLGIPWRLAFALQADGWFLRQAIIWAKGISLCKTYSGSCMPESVRDRPTTSHEYIFLLSKNRRYFYDDVAVREPVADYVLARAEREAAKGMIGKHIQHQRADLVGLSPTSIMRRQPGASVERHQAGRTLRSVLTINPQPTRLHHFAAYPDKIPELAIKAGTSERGVCPKCLAPWKRIVKKGLTAHDGETDSGYPDGTTAKRLALLRQAARERGEEYASTDTTIGWQPTCRCKFYRLRDDLSGETKHRVLERLRTLTVS